MTIRALADANVLYSRTLRDWLIMIQLDSGGGLYELCWTEDIMAEVIYNYRRMHPAADGASVTRIRDRITTSLANGRVDSFTVDGSFTGSDEHDQHVHAAAVAAGATYVITADGGFTSPDIDLDSLPYEVHSPDSFLVLVDDSAPHRVREVTRKQEKHWETKPWSKGLVGALKAADCPVFAQRVLEHLCHLPT